MQSIFPRINVTCGTFVVHISVHCVQCHHIYAFFKFFAAAPEWAETINNTQVDIGTQHSMRCVASGKPFPFIYWYKDGYRVKKYIYIHILPASITDKTLGRARHHFLCTYIKVYIWVLGVFSRLVKGSYKFPVSRLLTLECTSVLRKTAGALNTPTLSYESYVSLFCVLKSFNTSALDDIKTMSAVFLQLVLLRLSLTPWSTSSSELKMGVWWLSANPELLLDHDSRGQRAKSSSLTIHGQSNLWYSDFPSAVKQKSQTKFVCPFFCLCSVFP